MESGYLFAHFLTKIGHVNKHL